ncbi:MAG TPA: type III PLP-dependent enzyme [Acidobacteriota bacterium]|nr:type III PLP-dependent enzyme [Acidobacteriota bacterium]
MTHAVNVSSMTGAPVSRHLDTELIRDLFASTSAATPALLLSRSGVRRNCRALQAALPRADLHYAVKSNDHPAILRQVQRCGGSFDVCSVREIDAVLATGIDPARLIHSHPIKSLREFDQAVAKGVRVFVVDNVDETEKLRRYTNEKLRILIRFRINTNTTAVVNLQYKFGCTVDEVLPLAEKIRAAGHEYDGLCFHIGSQCIYPENYVKAIHAAHLLIHRLDLAGFDTTVFDIGGGFPVEYVEPVPAIDEFCAPIAEALQKEIRPGIRVICEPGRYISASPVTLLSTIIGKSSRDGKTWYYLDDGLYSTFSGIVYDQCQYPVISRGERRELLSVLAGPTCDSFDVMYDGLMIPEQQVGDMLVFPLTGAYCAVSGSTFNSLARPEYKVID